MIERNLPENELRRLEGQVLHWEEVTRRIGSALEFLNKSYHEFHNSPQKNEGYVVDKFSDLRVHLASQLADAKHQAIKAAEWAEKRRMEIAA